MGVFLVLASDSAFVDPLSVIFWQSVEVDPEGAWEIGDYSLWSIEIDWNFILGVFEIGKGSGWIAVSVKIIVFFFGEEGLVVFMFE